MAMAWGKVHKTKREGAHCGLLPSLLGTLSNNDNGQMEEVIATQLSQELCQLSQEATRATHKAKALDIKAGKNTGVQSWFSQFLP